MCGSLASYLCEAASEDGLPFTGKVSLHYS